MKHAITTPNAPGAVGPFSQALVHGGMVYCSGQISVDPATGQVIKDSVAQQTHRCLTHLAVVLEAAGTTMANVVTVDIALSSMEVFDEMNRIYTTFFSEPYPARMTVASAGIYADLDVEIKCIAHL